MARENRRTRPAKLPYRDAMRLHAVRAGFRRFGFALSVAEYEELVACVRTGKAEFLGRGGSLNRTIHRLQHRGRRICAVYDPAHDAIVTLVPQEFPPGFRRREARAS